MNATLLPANRDELRPKDWILILSLTSVWLVCLVLNMNMVFGDGESLAAFVPAFDRTEDGTPVVVLLAADREQGGDALYVGDRLVSMQGEDLAGISPIKFQFNLAEALHHGGKAALVIERDGEEMPVSIEASNTKISWSHIPPVIGYAAIALIVLLRAPGATASRLFFAGYMTLAIFQTGIVSGSGYQVVAGRFLFIIMGMISLALLMLWLITFPRPPADQDKKPRAPWWIAFIVPVLFPLPRLNYYVSGPLSPENYNTQTYGIDVLFTVLIIAVLGWNYYCVDATSRRKIRWVLLGVYGSFVPIALVQFSGAMFELGEWFFWLQSIAILFYVAVPLSLFIAMRHFNLFDVDRVISGSVWYTVILVLFALIAEAILEPVAASMAVNVGVEANTGQLIFVALLAGLAIPIQAFLRPKIEHLFFPHRENLRDSVEVLVEEIANSSYQDLEQMSLLIGTRISTMLELEDCGIYLYEEGSWQPVFRFGEKVNLQLDGARAADVRSLFQKRMAPIRLKQGNERESGYAELFEGVDAELIIPFQSIDDGCGFICLGRKRSKDVFTNTDVSLLAGVAVQVSLNYA